MAWGPLHGAGLEPGACPLACSTPALTRGEAGPRPWWHSSECVPGMMLAWEPRTGLGPRKPGRAWAGPQKRLAGVGMRAGQGASWSGRGGAGASCPAPVDLPLTGHWVMQMKPDREFAERSPATPHPARNVCAGNPASGRRYPGVGSEVGRGPRASHRDPAGPVLGAALKDWGSPMLVGKGLSCEQECSTVTHEAWGDTHTVRHQGPPQTWVPPLNPGPSSAIPPRPHLHTHSLRTSQGSRRDGSVLSQAPRPAVHGQPSRDRKRAHGSELDTRA